MIVGVIVQMIMRVVMLRLRRILPVLTAYNRCPVRAELAVHARCAALGFGEALQKGGDDQRMGVQIGRDDGPNVGVTGLIVSHGGLHLLNQPTGE